MTSRGLFQPPPFCGFDASCMRGKKTLVVLTHTALTNQYGEKASGVSSDPSGGCTRDDPAGWDKGVTVGALD